MLGNLTWAAIPFDKPIPLITGAVVILALLAILAWVVIDHQR
jgi:cytochrome o ubiquinol oxidase subunit 1